MAKHGRGEGLARLPALRKKPGPRYAPRFGLAVAVCLAGPGSAGAQNGAAQSPSEIMGLQKRLGDAGCYAGPLDGLASDALSAARKACPDQSPILRIETGMHTAPIKRIGVDAACRIAATGSDDKTVRLWSMPEGRLLRTQRLPIGAGGDVGKVYAVAVSPDGSLVAAGGADAHYDADGKDGVYIFDAATGQSLRRLGAFDQVVNHLVFSPDGRRLAVALGRGGIRVLEVASGREIMADQDFSDDSYGVVFGPDGTLFATGRDGFVRRYDADLKQTAKVATKAGQQPNGVAIDPSGTRLAVGFHDQPKVEIYGARTLQRLGEAETKDVANDDNNFNVVAWSQDGKSLIGGGYYHVKIGDDWRWPLRRWTPDGRRGGPDVPVAGRTIFDLARCSDSLAFAAAGPSFGLLHADGTAVTLATGHSADFRGALGPDFTASDDATRLRFGLAPGGKNPVAFDLAKGSLAAAPNALAGAVAPATSGLDVRDWRNSTKASLKGQKLALERYEISRSLAIRPAHDGFVLGTDWYIRAFDASGKERWNHTGPATAWGVDLVQNGAIVLAAYDDGTIRWHRWSDGAELLALFVDKTNLHWVAWTPTGYYTASPGGEDLIGWQINRGWEQQADFFPVSRFRDKFNRPDIVRLVLQTRDEAEAVAQANAAAQRHEDRKPLIERLPPVVTIVDPSDGKPEAPGPVEIHYQLRSPSGIKIDRIEAFVDGAKVAPRGAGRTDQDSGSITLPMPTHDATVGIVAYAGDLVSEPARVLLKTAAAPPVAGPGPAPADPDALKPTLYALLVGVSHYSDSSLDLGYAAADAEGLAEALQAQKGKLYRDVVIKLLADGEATSTAVKRGLSWLKKQTTARDIAVFFAAGHGLTDPKGRFWFLTTDVDRNELSTTAVSRSDITEALFDLPGRKVMFLDACHSGAALGSRDATHGGSTDVTAALNDFAQAEGGVVAYAASTGREVSLERQDWGHGAFTKALIEGLTTGEADLLHNGTITTSTLDAYIENRVKALTGGQQHAIMSRPDIVPDFPIALVR